jgi:hypothetical protein
MGVKISELTEAVSLNTTDLIAVVQGATSYKASLETLRELLALAYNSTPVAFVPSASGNATNLNEIVIGSDGNYYFIDAAGNALNFNEVVNWTIQNGLTYSGGVLKWGGPLTENTTINFGSYAIQFTGTGKLRIGTTNGDSIVNIDNGDIEFLDPAYGVIFVSANATRWKITVDNTGELISTSL